MTVTADTYLSDEDYADEIRMAQRSAQKVERKSILLYRMIMAGMLAVAIIAFVPINAAHNFQYFENMVGGIDAGTGWYVLYVSLAVALVVVSAGLWMLLPDTDGAIWGLCFAVAVGAGLFSHYASYLSLDTQSVSTIQEETANSAKSKIAMLGVEAMSARVKAASANSQSAAAAVQNLTSQYSNYDAASVGEINRNQLPGLTSAQHSSSLDLRAAGTALERMMQQANDTAGGAGEGTLATVFKDFGAQWGWTPEGTRVFTNAFGSGVISWVPLIVTFVMGYVAFKKPDEEGGGASAAVEDDDRQPVQRSRVMASSASGATDTVRGPVISDPMEVEGEGEVKRRAMFAPRKPERRSEPSDTVPGNSRQVAYSKKLAKVTAAIRRGKVVKPGDMLTGDVVKTLAGGGARDTIKALRNDLALAGVAHWRGSRLIAGG